MSGTLQATILKDGASSTNNLTFDSSGNVTVGNNLTVNGTSSHTGNATFSGTITGSSTVAGATGILYPLVSGTAQASTSGTAISFTSIPSWVKRVTLSFNGISTSGTSGLIVQLGSSAGYATGTYTGSATNGAGSVATSAFTTGHGLNGGPVAANAYYGTATFTLVSGNTWVGSSVLGATGTPQFAVGGSAIVLAATFDRIQLTTVNGTDTFDAGSINILYE